MKEEEKIFEKLEKCTRQLSGQLEEMRKKLEQENRLLKEMLLKEEAFREDPGILSEEFSESPYGVLLENVILMTEYLKRTLLLLTVITNELEGRRNGGIEKGGPSVYCDSSSLLEQGTLLENECREMEHIWAKIEEEAEGRIDVKETESLLRDYLEACREMNESLRQRAAEYEKFENTPYFEAPGGKTAPGGMPLFQNMPAGESGKRAPAAGKPAGSGLHRRKSRDSKVLASLKKVFSGNKEKTLGKNSEKKKAKRISERPGTEKEREARQNRRSVSDSRDIVTDEVQFKAAAPAQIETGSSFELKLYMYRQEEKALVEELLREFDAPAAAATSGIFEVARQQELKVVIWSEDVEIKEKTARLLWNGRLSLCGFLLYLPEAFAKKQAIVQARVYSGIMVLADLRLILRVQKNEPRNLNIPVETRRIRSAFASYSSKDRAQVVARLQGMQAMNPELDLFFDRESLRTGEHWEERLFREIETRDIFYLFWSRSAAVSEWVNKEWHHALETRGESAIEPVPLESPEICPPPVELRGLHFDNWALRYTQANN